HVGIYRGLIEQAGISAADEPQLFDAFQRKAATELEQIVHRVVSDESFREQLITLNSLNGGIEILAKAKSVLDCAVHPAIEQLEKIAAIAEQQQWGVELHFDLAELRGYDYHTGVLFAAYVPQKGIAVAQGGRYDNVGAVFGRARPATGFSGDLKNLVAIEKEHNYPPPAIFASHDESIALYQEIERLRRAGERVVVELPGQHQSAQEMGCDRKLVQQEGRWTVATL
ncbi:MAG TPA: ATP phosphoribosyltransferase regulatory subunit, partial [Gammaproteobacteria bacterium]|nr:ATP phosphoribosyltransferase regulatory subunit [Gammaproteobacteria bacterium]